MCIKSVIFWLRLGAKNKMKLAIMQPYFFPYIGYFQLINAVDKYILYDNLNYIKEGWVHRNKILINGNPFYIIANVKKKSSFKKINRIFLDDDKRWKDKMLKGILLHYKSAPFFDEVYPFIKILIYNENVIISKYNIHIISEICNFLEIDTIISTEIEQYTDLEKKLEKENFTMDNFSHISLEKVSPKVVRVIEICNKEKASIFINAIGGKILYNKDEFKKNGIDLFFVKTNEIYYSQKKAAKFIPHLSIIDVLMNCGKEETKKLLKQYTLV